MKRHGCCMLLWIAVGGAMMFVSHTATAQTVQQQGYRPVDQMVDDVDPTQVSLRRENTGLSVIGERQNVFRRIVPDARPYQPGNERLYYVSYGIVAEFDRSEYGMITDDESPLKGAILQFIPPNTVFHIGLPQATKSAVDPNQPVPGRVDSRIDAQVLAPSVAGQSLIQPSQSRDVERDQVEAERYGETLAVQRGLLVAAIRRVSQTHAP